MRLNTAELWFSDSDLVLTRPKQSTHLDTLPKLHLNPHFSVHEGETLLALDEKEQGDYFAQVKRLVVTSALQGRLHYQSNQPCGLAGTIVFNAQWDPVGVQLTQRNTANEAVNSALLLAKLKESKYVPLIYALIERLEPAPTQNEDYLCSLQSASRPQQPLVVGLGGRTKTHAIIHSLNTGERLKLPIETDMGEGASVCLLPSGFAVSGGKANKRKAYLYFFGDFQQFHSLELPTAHYTHTSIYYQDKLFFIGGRNSSGAAMKIVDSFDIHNTRWEKQVPLRIDRSYPGVCILGDRLLVLGGQGMAETHTSIEMYTNSLLTMYGPKLPVALTGLRVIVLSDKDILIFGGRSEMPNSKVFKVDFAANSFTLQAENREVQQASSCEPLYTDHYIAFFNNDGDLFQLRRQDLQLARLVTDVTCRFT